MKYKWLVLLVIVVLLFTLYRQTIFQEGNPIPLVIGIVKVTLDSKTPVEINSVNSSKYIVKKDNLSSKYGLISQSLDAYIDIMHQKNWVFKEQIGSSLVFTQDKKVQTVATRMYSRYYIIIDNSNP